MTENNIPLCVDLDGTLIRDDTLQVAIKILLRQNFLYLFLLPIWLLRGRAYLKRQVAQRVTIDPAALSYNEKFMNWVKQQKSIGRKVVLVTATDKKFADAVADYVNIFDEVIASDGKTNIRSNNKRDALIEKFGIYQYDYCGNDYPDIAVWATAHKAIVVNAPKRLVAQCKQYKNLGEMFE